MLRLRQIRVEAAVHVHFAALGLRQLTEQRAHVRGGHRQEQVGAFDFVARDAMREMVRWQLVAAFLKYLDGTAVDRIAVFLVADAAGFDVDLVIQAAALEFA